MSTINDINEKLAKKLEGGREYRDMKVLEIRAAAEGEQNEEKKVAGYATTFNDPYLLYDWGDYRVYEQVDPHAFDECDMSDVIMQYNHEGRVYARTSNDTLKLTVDNHGLFCEADLSGTSIGHQLYEEIKGGYTTKMSFGFIVAENTRVITEDRENNLTTVLRTITKISKLFDVSAVSIPANDATEISSRNYGEGVIAEIKQELLERANKERQIQRIRILAER